MSEPNPKPALSRTEASGDHSVAISGDKTGPIVTGDGNTVNIHTATSVSCRFGYLSDAPARLGS